MELLNNKRADARFYTCIIMGFIIILIGIFCPPIGEIGVTLLYASGMFLIVGALALGLDIAGIIREIRLLKQLDVTITENNKKESNDNNSIYDLETETSKHK